MSCVQYLQVLLVSVRIRSVCPLRLVYLAKICCFIPIWCKPCRQLDISAAGTNQSTLHMEGTVICLLPYMCSAAAGTLWHSLSVRLCHELFAADTSAAVETVEKNLLLEYTVKGSLWKAPP